VQLLERLCHDLYEPASAEARAAAEQQLSAISDSDESLTLCTQLLQTSKVRALVRAVHSAVDVRASVCVHDTHQTAHTAHCCHVTG
jgi:hypothetical protein